MAIEPWEAEWERDLNDDGDMDDWVMQIVDLRRGTISNTALAMPWPHAFRMSSNRLMTLVSEATQGQDLNGDGDQLDNVLYGHQFEPPATWNLGITLRNHLQFFDLAPYGLAIVVREQDANTDLNGDGDTVDGVLGIYDWPAGPWRNTGLAVTKMLTTEEPVQFSGEWLIFVVGEADQNNDLNGDGDIDDFIMHVMNLRTGEVLNLGLPPLDNSLTSRWLAGPVVESTYGNDLNGDGALDDFVCLVYDLANNVVINAGIALERFDTAPCQVVGHWLAFPASELYQGQDLNGDGDMSDAAVWHVLDLETGELTPLLSTRRNSLVSLSGQWLVTRGWEDTAGIDANGDGDHDDMFVYIYDFESRQEIIPSSADYATWYWTVSGNWVAFTVGNSQLHLYDMSARRNYDLGLRIGKQVTPGTISGDYFAFAADENFEARDLNGDSDTLDHVAHVLNLAALSGPRSFIRGDSNPDSSLDISDAVAILGFLFLGSTMNDCMDAADVNDDGRVDISDPVRLLGFLFLGSERPPDPFGTCGIDPTIDDLDCASYPGCP